MTKHYFQACTYQTSENGRWLPGIAKVAAFGLCDVAFIIDMNGRKIPKKEMYDYVLSAPSYDRSVVLVVNVDDHVDTELTENDQLMLSMDC